MKCLNCPNYNEDNGECKVSNQYVVNPKLDEKCEHIDDESIYQDIEVN